MPAAGLGKISAKPANHGQSAFLDHDLAKTRDNPRRLGKFQGKPPMMAIGLICDRHRAKVSATLSGGLGKNPGEIANHGDHALIGARSCQSQRQPATGLGKIRRESPIMASSKEYGDRIAETQGSSERRAEAGISGFLRFLALDSRESAGDWAPTPRAQDRWIRT